MEEESCTWKRATSHGSIKHDAVGASKEKAADRRY